MWRGRAAFDRQAGPRTRCPPAGKSLQEGSGLSLGARIMAGTEVDLGR